MTTEIDVKNILKMHKDMNTKELPILLEALFIKAAALTCAQVPESNATWAGNAIRFYKNIDISFIHNDGKKTHTPIIFDAAKKGIVTISENMNALIAKIKEKKITPDETIVLQFL